MSRVGQQPIAVPSGVDVQIEPGRVRAKGPLGELEARFPAVVDVDLTDDVVVVRRNGDSRTEKAFHGLARSLISNAIVGVSQGFQKALEIQGVGYRAQLEGRTLQLQVGCSHPVVVEPPDGITFEVPSASEVIVKGPSKELVGQIAANIRGLRPPEPYKGKGIRYQGEYVRRKVGKAVK